MRLTLYKSLSAIIFVILFVSCSNSQTFVVADIILPSNSSERRIQRTRDNLIGVEVNFLYSDNDVKLTLTPKDGKSEVYILKKIDSNLYRYEDEYSVMDLELNTIMGYTESCKFSQYRIGYRISMDFKWTMILERK